MTIALTPTPRAVSVVQTSVLPQIVCVEENTSWSYEYIFSDPTGDITAYKQQKIDITHDPDDESQWSAVSPLGATTNTIMGVGRPGNTGHWRVVAMLASGQEIAGTPISININSEGEPFFCDGITPKNQLAPILNGGALLHADTPLVLIDGSILKVSVIIRNDGTGDATGVTLAMPGFAITPTSHAISVGESAEFIAENTIDSVEAGQTSITSTVIVDSNESSPKNLSDFVVAVDRTPASGGSVTSFGGWEQPTDYKGQAGTIGSVTSNPAHRVNFMHMHRANLRSDATYYIVPIINDVDANGGMSMTVQLDEEQRYKTNLRFHFDLWEAMIDEMVADAPTYNAITTAINNGIIKAIYLMDEPHASHHWNPKVQPPELELMGQKIKSIWPGVKTVVRAPLRHLEANFGYHDYQYVDYTYLTWSFIQVTLWTAGQRQTAEQFWRRDLKPYGQQSIMKPWLMLQSGRGPEYDVYNLWSPHGINQDGWINNWYEETGLNETQVKQRVQDKTYIYYADSPDFMDYGVYGAMQKRNGTLGDPDYGRLDPNGDYLIDTIAMFRRDRNGGSNPDSGNTGTLPMPWSEEPAIVQGYYDIRDKLADFDQNGTPFQARLLQRHPQWTAQNDPNA